MSLILEMYGNMCIATVCFPGFGVINFEIKHSNQAAFLLDQNFRTKV